MHFGAITINEIQKRGIAVSEANEREVREELRKAHGMAAYAKLSLARIKHALSVGPTVIDGLYSWSEYKFLKQQLPNRMYVIAVSAPRHIRYERLSHRLTRPLSYKEAELRDFAEIENLEKGGPIAIADYTIQNSGIKRELFSVLDRLLSTLFSQKT